MLRLKVNGNKCERFDRLWPKEDTQHLVRGPEVLVDAVGTSTRMQQQERDPRHDITTADCCYQQWVPSHHQNHHAQPITNLPSPMQQMEGTVTFFLISYQRKRDRLEINGC